MNYKDLLQTIINKRNPLLSAVVCQKIDNSFYLCGGNKHLFAFFKTYENPKVPEIEEFTRLFHTVNFIIRKKFSAKDVKEEINGILLIIKEYNKKKKYKEILKNDMDSEAFRNSITLRKNINCPKLFYTVHRGMIRLVVKLDSLDGICLPLPTVKFIDKAFENDEQLYFNGRETNTCFISDNQDKIIISANFINDDFTPINQ